MTSSAEAPPWLADFHRRASELGFVGVGIAPAIEATGFSRLLQWIDRGYAAGMDYFADRKDAYRHPDGVMPGTRSILAMMYPYPADAPQDVGDGIGAVARYAWSGVDYHDVIHRKLKTLRTLIREAAPEVDSRGCVDTAPLLERELAESAGLGWRGKNTLLLNRQWGSYFFLACVLVDVELPYDAPADKSYCGTCTACLDACPTDAFPEPGVLDGSRCISYLTIEHRGEIDEAMFEGIGDWAFGCDICQEVCPWNRKRSRRETPKEATPLKQLELIRLFELSDDDFRAQYRKTPFWRTRRRGLLRNAAIVLGNQCCRDALDALERATADEDPAVSKAATWAVKRIQTR